MTCTIVATSLRTPLSDELAQRFASFDSVCACKSFADSASEYALANVALELGCRFSVKNTFLEFEDVPTHDLPARELSGDRKDVSCGGSRKRQVTRSHSQPASSSFEKCSAAIQSSVTLFAPLEIPSPDKGIRVGASADSRQHPALAKPAPAHSTLGEPARGVADSMPATESKRSGAEKSKRTCRPRPCKGQRTRHRKHVQRLEEAMKNAPESFDPRWLEMPPSIASNDRVRDKVLARLNGVVSNATAVAPKQLLPCRNQP